MAHAGGSPALLPLLAGLGVWAVNEVKQYHEGYRALEERDLLAAEKAELQRQKDSLNIEVSTLLDLKRHYAEQAQDLQARFEQRQQQLDATYARARFASAEASYALGHSRVWAPARTPPLWTRFGRGSKRYPRTPPGPFTS